MDMDCDDCDGSDLDGNGTVGFGDLIRLCQRRLEQHAGY
jgi:hypothetical protein